jgi:parvulin-like peptidyl-prolyl isomerase
VATYDGGAVTQEELDRKVRDLPAAERRPEPGEEAAWRERLARDRAAEEILLAEAREAGRLEPPELEPAFRELEHQAAVAAYLEAHLERPAPPTEEELRAAYEGWREEYVQEERRLVYHLYKRLTPGGDPAAVAAEIEALRDRVLAGENFRLLAGAHSDSEARHREGMLGWVGRGDLDPVLEQVIFALPLQVPSEPLRTASGTHLFWVESLVEGKPFAFEEVRVLVARRLLNERREAQARALLRIAPPEGSFVPDEAALTTLLEARDPEALVLRLGDFELRAGAFGRRLLEARRGGSRLSALGYLDALVTRELLYLQCREEGCDAAPQVAERVAALRERALAQHELERRLREELRASRTEIEEHYQRGQARYSDPVRWRLTRLAVPFGQDPGARMALLEEALPALDAGSRTLEQLASELGGRVEELGWRPLGALQAESPTVAEVVPRLQPGGHTPPFRTRDALVVLRCEERLEPAPLPLVRVEDRVLEDLLAAQGQELYRAFRDRLLAERDFRMLPAVGAGEAGSRPAA